ncbi:right-handed parallel beta-helix repeat-containing protein [Sphingomonas sp. JC676]|uniref:right-handed parallel beta-helix repeat-containing protein n=1 Tax=Sphingomonas sp. JC676 TaxID=2768065 RepID=UPI001657D3F0|nr:right-handed parallel beta-helix repeat-containing protein [Sphingomonas sp. JC676]MBC9032797.1 right-handed parallel beta-helix repeat-containing protein [Sphingomonas sp. JC676]
MPDIIVKNQTELDAALNGAKGGETIKLAAGTYSNVTLTNRNFASNITITSVDVKNPATVQRVALNSASNVTFQGLTLGRQISPPEAEYTQLHNVNKSSNIVFDHVTITGGSGDASKSIGWGLFVRDSSNVTLTNSSFDHTSLALEVSNVTGMVVKDNTFSDNRRDGINFAAVTNVVIDGNFFTNMHPVNGEHPDAIQFLTNGTTTASSNIVIKNNIIMQGSGEAIQGIFLNDEVGTLPYQNVDITNNLIYVNGQYNGISVTGGKNINIQQNTVVSRTDDAIPAWIRLERVDGATVVGNVGDRLVANTNTSNIVVGANSWLSQDSVLLRKFENLNAAGAAKLSGMIVGDLGYHPPAGSAAAALVASENANAKPSPTRNLLLDLEFNSTGLADKSRFASVITTAAIDMSNVSNGYYHVQTGKGFELSRANSVQLFALPAFTLSFNLMRDSMTAPVGQILGVHQSWSVSLTSSGELNFAIKNDAGTSYSIVTQGARLVDTASHKIGLTYDSATGRAVIYVDSVARGTGAIGGPSKALESWGLYVGSPFGAAFSGKIGNIEMRDQALNAAQIVSLNTASGFGVLSLLPAFAGMVGQIVSNGAQAKVAAMVEVPVLAADVFTAPASTGNVAMGGIVASIPSISTVPTMAAAISTSTSANLSAAPLSLTTLRVTKACGFDLLHA